MSHTLKTLRHLDGRLVSVTTEYIHPPIAYRGSDYCARYSNDESDAPNYGWGETRQLAIDDLITTYDYEDTLPTFAELYAIDLLYARLHWQGIERSYQGAK